MRNPHNLERHASHYIGLTLALLVLTGAMLLGSSPTAFTAVALDPIWSPAVNLGSAFNSTASDQQPAISPDGLSLYFASNRTPGGLGGFDLYVSQRASVSDAWGSAVNLGPAINTTFDEGNAAFSRDGRLMFFQSRRPSGFGALDIWFTTRNNPHDDFNWQPAVNLGPNINTTADDNAPAFFEDEVQGTRQLFFASSRLGLADLYVSQQLGDGSFEPAALLTSLSSPMTESDPTIRFDGLEIIFQSNRVGSSGPNDLWVATRNSTLDAWSTPVNLASPINGASSEQNAYLSSDGMTLFFGSDRAGAGGFGGVDLYMSTRTLPTVRSKHITVGADDACTAAISPGDLDDGSFDPVNGGPLTLSIDPAGPFNLGQHSIRLVATDNRGATNSAVAVVTVEDQTPPSITAPPSVNATTGGPGSNLAGAFVSDATLGAASASDTCSAVQIMRGHVPPGNFFPVGITNITYTATDDSGNSISVTQSVTVTDDTPPIVTPPVDITTDATSPAGALVNYVVTANDNVGVSSLTCAPASGSIFHAGQTVVHCTALDAAGNSASTSFQVRVRGAAEQIVALIQLATGQNLPPAIRAQLVAALQRALNNPRNVIVACRNLDTFIVLVRVLSGRWIPPVRANQLINDAVRIKAVLGCHC